MKISITQGHKIYEINLMQLTQLCGKNFEIKEFITTSLSKYFSATKYYEYEEVYLENIKVNDATVGRKYFECHCIKDRQHLIEMVKISKNSLMSRYIQRTLQEYEYQKDIERLTDVVDNIFDKLNKDILKDFENIELQYYVEKILGMVCQSEVRGLNGKYIEVLSNVELLNIYLDLIEKVQELEPTKTLIIIHNIDHLITYEEYELVCERMNAIGYRYDCWFCLTTSIEGYVMLDEEWIEGINSINDEIYTLPSWEHIERFIEQYYPCHLQLDKMNLMSGIQQIVQRIGESNICLDQKSGIYLKMLNQSLGIKIKVLSGLNKLENSFLSE